MEWQPIETAPKVVDANGMGPTVRLYFPYYVHSDLQLERPAPGQREGFWAETVVGYGSWVTPGTMSSEDPSPTHWMPLPEPPNA